MTKAVTYQNSETGFGSLRIVKGVDRLIIYQRYRHGGRTSITFYRTYDLPYIYLRIPTDLLDLEVKL
jgi:hypothetical protein